jgi:hypothetical protein
MKYAKEKGLIEYDDEFIKNILVFKEKGVKTFVDEREEARYGPKIKMDDVKLRYDSMLNLCKKALFQAQDIVFSEKKYEIPKEFF